MNSCLWRSCYIRYFSKRRSGLIYYTDKSTTMLKETRNGGSCVGYNVGYHYKIKNAAQVAIMISTDRPCWWNSVCRLSWYYGCVRSCVISVSMSRLAANVYHIGRQPARFLQVCWQHHSVRDCRQVVYKLHASLLPWACLTVGRVSDERQRPQDAYMYTVCCSDDYEKHITTAFTLPYDSCMLFFIFCVLYLSSTLLWFSAVQFVLQSTVIHWLSITISICGSIILGFELFRLWQPQSRGSSRLYNVLFLV